MARSKKRKLDKNETSRTRGILKYIDRRCAELPCNDPSGANSWNCKNCRFSNAYEQMAGIRLEDMPGDLIDYDRYKN